MDFQYPPQILGEWRKLTAEQKVEWLDAAREKNFAASEVPYVKQLGRRIEIDGRDIQNELSFYCAVGEAVNGPGGYFGRKFSGFDDCLFGGFGLDAPWQFIWKNSQDSRKYLNAEALLNFCKKSLANNPEIHTEAFREGKESILSSIEKAKDGKLTLFDIFVDSIRSVEERSMGDLKVTLTLE